MRIFIALFIVLFFSRCGDKGPTPEGVLEPDKMEAVMYDMIRTGEFLNGYVLFKDTGIDKTAESMKWYTKVWAMHKVTEAQFEKSYDWYQRNPDMMKIVMDSIIKIPAPVVKSDSTKSAADSLNKKINRRNVKLPDSTRRLLTK